MKPNRKKCRAVVVAAGGSDVAVGWLVAAADYEW